MTKTVECYATDQDGEVIGNQLKSEKFNKNLIHVDSEKKGIQPTERTKRVSFYQSLFLNKIRIFLTWKTLALKSKTSGTAQHVKNESILTRIRFHKIRKDPYVALQSLSSINFFSLVLLSTVEIESLSNDENGKKQ